MLTLDSSRISFVCICPINVPSKSSNISFFFLFCLIPLCLLIGKLTIFLSLLEAQATKREINIRWVRIIDSAHSRNLRFLTWSISLASFSRRKKNRIILIILSWQIRFSLFSFLYWLNFYVLVANKLWKQSATWPRI